MSICVEKVLTKKGSNTSLKLYDIGMVKSKLLEEIEAKNRYNIFHTPSWINSICRAYNFNGYYAIVEEDKQIITTVPLVEVCHITGKRKIVILPFTDECCPLIMDNKNFDLVIDLLKNIAQKRKWNSIEFRGDAWFPQNTPATQRYYGHHIDLCKSEERLFSALSGSTRRNVKKAIREGVKVKFGSDDVKLSEFFRLMCITRKRHGLPPQPYRFFKILQENILVKEKGFFACATHYDKTIATNLYLFENRHAVYKYGASDNRMQHLRANDLLMWKSMRKLSNMGIVDLNLGRTDLHHEGLRRFKRGFGSQEYIIKYFKLDLTSSQFVKQKNEKKLNLLPLVFKRMPVWTLRVLGDWIYRYAA